MLAHYSHTQLKFLYLNIRTQVWTTVSEWLTGESREYVRRLAAPTAAEDEAAVLGRLYCSLVCVVYIHVLVLQHLTPLHTYTHTLATLLARPEARERRRLLDARKREMALGQVLSPHLAPAIDALRPVLLLRMGGGLPSLSPAKVTARAQGLLATLELARALPVFLSSKHVRMDVCLFVLGGWWMVLDGWIVWVCGWVSKMSTTVIWFDQLRGRENKTQNSTRPWPSSSSTRPSRAARAGRRSPNPNKKKDKSKRGMLRRHASFGGCWPVWAWPRRSIDACWGISSFEELGIGDGGTLGVYGCGRESNSDQSKYAHTKREVDFHN